MNYLFCFVEYLFRLFLFSTSVYNIWKVNFAKFPFFSPLRGVGALLPIAGLFRDQFIFMKN